MAKIIDGLCRRWGQPPSVILAQDATVLRMVDVLNRGTPDSPEGGELP